jgi:hypothetical protein
VPKALRARRVNRKLFTLYHPSMRPYIERADNEWADLLGEAPPDPKAFPAFGRCGGRCVLVGGRFD